MPAPDLVEARWLPPYAVQRADGTQLEPGDTCHIPPGEARESDHWEILDDPDSRPLDKWPIDDLRALADEEGVDLDGATKKVDIAAAIEASRADVAQLRILAEEEGADVAHLTTKADIEQAIEQHRADRIAAEHEAATSPPAEKETA